MAEWLEALTVVAKKYGCNRDMRAVLRKWFVYETYIKCRELPVCVFDEDTQQSACARCSLVTLRPTNPAAWQQWTRQAVAFSLALPQCAIEDGTDNHAHGATVRM